MPVFRHPVWRFVTWEFLSHTAGRVMATNVASEGRTRLIGEVARPYKSVPITQIADQIQHDYSNGHLFDEALVFEVLNRALEAEGAVFTGDKLEPR